MPRLSEPEDSYSDDPVDLKPRRRSLQLSALSKFVLFATALSFVTVTLGANITIVGGKIEFGQGNAGVKVCVNSNDLNVQQQTSYTSGAFRLKTITIGNIPISCHGFDIIISILKPGAAGSSTLATLFGSVTKLIIYDKDGSFYVTSADGSYVSLSSTTDGTIDNLTITFTTPLVVNSDIGTLGVETSENTLTNLACGGGGDCPVGVTGPGGGIVIAQLPVFQAPGSACNLACHGLEVDTVTGTSGVAGFWSGSGALIGAYSHGIGGGYANTQLVQTSPNGGNNSNDNTTAHGAISYCWNHPRSGISDHWYLPDVMEYAYIFDAVRQNSSIRSKSPSWPFVTNYITSEEAPSNWFVYGNTSNHNSSANTSGPSQYSTYRDIFTADGPPLSVTNSYYRWTSWSDFPNNALAIHPLNDGGATNGGDANSSFSNYSAVQIYNAEKFSGYSYAIICLHAIG